MGSTVVRPALPLVRHGPARPAVETQRERGRERLEGQHALRPRRLVRAAVLAVAPAQVVHRQRRAAGYRGAGRGKRTERSKPNIRSSEPVALLHFSRFASTL